jgi:hypothetical protein
MVIGIKSEDDVYNLGVKQPDSPEIDGGLFPALHIHGSHSAHSNRFP